MSPVRLFLDTTDNLKTVVCIDNHTFVKNYSSPREQDVLLAIDESLKQCQIQRSDIGSIEVHLGPGSFTGLRVGISIAQGLSFGLNIPLNNQGPNSILTPEYGAPVSITVKK